MLSERTVEALLAFRRERNWEQFHSPKNLAIALAVEASEVLQEFEWTTSDSGPRDARGGKERIRLEMADVAILLTYLANDLGIDIEEAVLAKLAVNQARYPVESSHGTPAKYNEK